jgi:hypothetical protein
MARFGIPQGATFVATYLKDADRAALIKGDLVVIDAPTKRSPSGLRLRCIDKFSDGNAEFDADHNGQPHQVRAVSTILAKVTHVIHDQVVMSTETKQRTRQPEAIAA